MKRFSGFHSLSGLPLFAFNHSPSSFRFTLKTFGLPSESFCAKCHPCLHLSKASAPILRMYGWCGQVCGI